MRVSLRGVALAIANGSIEAAFGARCPGCHGRLANPLCSPACDECWASVAHVTRPWCERCGDALPSAGPAVHCTRCRRQPPRFEAARSAGRYDGSLRALIHTFKYRGCRALARPLAKLARDAGSDLLEVADAVVPVPLHPVRAWSRGFNQADDLARHLGVPVWRALRRVRHGPAQASLPAARRHRNVRAAFVAKANQWPHVVGRRWRASLEGKTVVLIDDVMTTGATLGACSAALLEGGVGRVYGLTVARASRPEVSLSPRS